MIQKTISEGIFDETFVPQRNHLDSNASWNGNMFETFGHELEYVQQVLAETPGRVWTILDCDGKLVVSSGFHPVNRMGYLITEVACPDGEMIEVDDEDPSLDSDEDEEAMPTRHRVVWEIDVDATSPVDAAREALSLMPHDLDDDNLAKHFLVTSTGLQKHKVELMPNGNFVVEHVNGALPYGIFVTVVDGRYGINSSLAKQFQEEDGSIDEAGQASADAIESLLMALAAEGVDVHTPAFSRAIEVAAVSIADHLS